MPSVGCGPSGTTTTTGTRRNGTGVWPWLANPSHPTFAFGTGTITWRPSAGSRRRWMPWRRESKGIPLNLLVPPHFASGLRNAGRIEEAEDELRRILELDENFPMAVGTLGAVCAQQGKLGEALALSEKAYGLTPWSNPIVGQLAALLVRTGAASRAETLLEGLRPGTAWGAPAGHGRVSCDVRRIRSGGRMGRTSDRKPVSGTHPDPQTAPGAEP